MSLTPNPEQQKAILQTEGPVLVLAGAGSGKTRVITLRIVHLLKQGVPSENILAVTFTNKAAQEMAERIEAMVSLQSKPFISTFHSYCCRVLRKECNSIGFRANFSIYSTTDQLSLLKQIIKKLNLPADLKPEEVLPVISLAKSKALSPEAFKETYPDKEVSYQIYDQYQSTLAAFNSMDFDDLLLHTVELFKKNPGIAKQYQSEFTHIMIDEYQDTNPVQFELVALLSEPHKNLCVVGDDDQGIYSFRGAQADNLAMFQRKYPDTLLIKLEQNYRSTNQILQAGNLLIQNNDSRISKTLWSKKPDGPPIRLLVNKDEREEARRVCEAISQHRTMKQNSFDEYSLLFRTNSQTRLFEEELRRQQIPYRLIGGVKFYDRREIRDLLSYLSVINNSRDELSLYRVINVPTRGIGNTSLKKLNQLCLREKKGVFALMKRIEDYPEIATQARKGITAFVQLIRQCRKLERTEGLVSMTDHLLAEINFEQEIARHSKNYQESERRWNNVTELLNGLKQFQETEKDPTLSEYMKSVALFLKDDLQKDKKELQKGKATLITLHACKGLEFPHVFMVGLEEDLLPHFRSVSAKDICEERRLCYVGITRAKETLVLSYAKQRTQHNKIVPRFRSRFLDEIETELTTDEPEWSEEQKDAVRQASLDEIRKMLFKNG